MQPADLWRHPTLLLLLEHYEDHIALYARTFGPGTKPPQVPEWYWHDVADCGRVERADAISDALEVIDLRTIPAYR